MTLIIFQGVMAMHLMI